MRNVWRGLVIGGLTGSLVGALMDALRRENLEHMASKARDLGDLAAMRARATGGAVVDRVRESDLRAVVDRVRESELLERVEHVRGRGEEIANGRR
jgi:hypothetical protein